MLDVSQSMAATEGAIERIERAKTTAANYLRYRPGLWANLILAGASARAVFERLRPTSRPSRDELARCRGPAAAAGRQRGPRAGRANARARLAEDDARRRELIVVSDFQRSNWTRANFGPLPEATLIQLESVAGVPAPENLAILGVAADAAGARGRSTQLRVEIGNFSPQTAQRRRRGHAGRNHAAAEGGLPARTVHDAYRGDRPARSRLAVGPGETDRRGRRPGGRQPAPAGRRDPAGAVLRPHQPAEGDRAAVVEPFPRVRPGARETARRNAPAPRRAASGAGPGGSRSRSPRPI